ncbi:MAG TPA: hypothetical protein VK518_22260 [Puia sp.]|nr:hypothetical protein [Puia sp.]
MKKLLILSALVAATSLIATKSYSQVYVNAHVGFGVPVAYETEFPGYAYYSYPAWNGHYRDRFYYAHYRPYFERDHRTYFNRGRFDRARFEHERVARGHYDRGHNDHGRRW